MLLIYLQFFCVVIAAYTTEISSQTTDSAYAASHVCYSNPKAEISGGRICHSLIGVAISSILVCMVLMIFDVFIPCVNTKVMIIYYVHANIHACMDICCIMNSYIYKGIIIIIVLVRT